MSTTVAPAGRVGGMWSVGTGVVTRSARGARAGRVRRAAEAAASAASSSTRSNTPGRDITSIGRARHVSISANQRSTSSSVAAAFGQRGGDRRVGCRLERVAGDRRAQLGASGRGRARPSRRATAARRPRWPRRTPAPARRDGRGGRATASRIAIVCLRPIVMPRPTDGFVHEWASAIERTPVATGAPSTTKWRIRSTAPLIVTMSLIGSPSSQWAWSGNARQTRSNVSGSRTRAQRRVVGHRVDGDRPRAVVGRDRQQRDRPARREARCARLGHRPVGRSVEATGVGEPEVLRRLGRAVAPRWRRATPASASGGRWRRRRARRGSPRRRRGGRRRRGARRRSRRARSRTRRWRRRDGPRRRASAASVAANAHSIDGRRAVTLVKRSSSGRGVPPPGRSASDSSTGFQR